MKQRAAGIKKLGMWAGEEICDNFPPSQKSLSMLPPFPSKKLKRCPLILKYNYDHRCGSCFISASLQIRQRRVARGKWNPSSKRLVWGSYKTQLDCLIQCDSLIIDKGTRMLRFLKKGYKVIHRTRSRGNKINITWIFYQAIKASVLFRECLKREKSDRFQNEISKRSF